MSIKLYLQFVICGMFGYNAHAGIMMSRSKKFEFLCDNSELIKKSESTQEIVVAQIESKMDASPEDSYALVKKPELSEFDRLGLVGFGKKYGMAHYLVIRLGMQNNLPQIIIDQIVEHAKHIPEEKKSIKYFTVYKYFESYNTLKHLVDSDIKKNNSCFGSRTHFMSYECAPDEKDQSDFRKDFKAFKKNEDRFPYEEWLALGCSQDVELSLSRLNDMNRSFLKELTDIILSFSKFGSSCCDSLQERAVDAESGIVKVFDAKNSLKRTFKHENGLRFMRIIYNPDGTELATQDVGGTITFWDLKEGRSTHIISASPLLPCLYFNEGKEFIYGLDGLHWRVIRWALFKKFERNDYSIEKCNLIETLLDKKIEAVNDETESEDLDKDIKCLVITDENDNINCSYDDYMKLGEDFDDSDVSSTESES